MAIIEMEEDEESSHNLVGPVIRSGHLAEAVIEAVEADNPGKDVMVMDRDDYVRIHCEGECRLSYDSLAKAYGSPYPLASLEIDMPSWKGRMRSRHDELTWFYANLEAESAN